jgi:hypothetical protein
MDYEKLYRDIRTALNREIEAEERRAALGEHSEEFKAESKGYKAGLIFAGILVREEMGKKNKNIL